MEGAMEETATNEVRREGVARRAAMLALAGGLVLPGTIRRAEAQTSSSVDTASLQFALNTMYLTTNLMQVVSYGDRAYLDANLIRSGDALQEGTIPVGARQISFPSGTRLIRGRFTRIADEHWNRISLLRGALRADAPAQTLIDYSPATFNAMFQMAGAISSNTMFDPYASPANCLVALETLVSVQASVFCALLQTLTNPIALAFMASMAASTASDATVIRAMIFELQDSRPDLTAMIDRIAAWRDRVDGTSVTDRMLSPVTNTGETVTQLATSNAEGLYLTRLPQQALNVLFMSAAAVTKGGFFPNGINGKYVQSAAN
jgi:hypothetical protein